MHVSPLLERGSKFFPFRVDLFSLKADKNSFDELPLLNVYQLPLIERKWIKGASYIGIIKYVLRNYS